MACRRLGNESIDWRGWERFEAKIKINQSISAALIKAEVDVSSSLFSKLMKRKI